MREALRPCRNQGQAKPKPGAEPPRIGGVILATVHPPEPQAMTHDQQRALLTLCLMAAFADAGQNTPEREHIRRIAQSLSGQGEQPIDVMPLMQDVLLGRADLAACAAQLGDASQRQLAYEMALGVCEADGSTSPAEADFLQRLASALGLNSDATAPAHAVAQQAALADAPLDGPWPLVLAPQTGAGSDATGTGDAGRSPQPASSGERPSSLPATELRSMILNASILNGALELLPETLASMAIIPLQTRLVYRVGQAHGYEMDRGHIKDFLATVGVGLTSQYVEQFGRKLLGGLLGSLGGKLGRGVGQQTASSAMSFVSTYALGHVAWRYYAGGRQLDGASLKAAFSDMTASAQSLRSEYLPQMQERARTLNLQQILAQVRGG
ncbi:DUF533 domain-containing protein [Amphibiibacter pelophylacis]|uniref:DUF533 domain-containing protein n=1 Tax=Amphibiibacter pelophylacis TaxID=1799477 RepID=A0ACC6P392_9BURK